MKPTCNPNTFKRLVSMHTPVCIISDCVGRDPDAELRLSMAVQGFIGMNPTMRHVQSEIGMSFLMADSLTRCPRPGVVIANIAPRNGAHHYENGIPFSYFRTKSGHLVVSTAQPEAFVSFKLLGEIPKEGVRIVNTTTAVRAMVKAGFLRQEFAANITDSQFRSLDFEPLLATAVLLGIKMPEESVIKEKDIPDVSNSVAYHDRFGNVKLWILEKRLQKLKDGDKVMVRTPQSRTELPFYRQLRDVPDDIMALIVGSSGPHGRHFCEIVTNGGKASSNQDFAIGNPVEIVT